MDLGFGAACLPCTRIMKILYFHSNLFIFCFDIFPFNPHRLYFVREVGLQLYFFPKRGLIVLTILLNDPFLCLKCFQIPKFSFKGPHARFYSFSKSTYLSLHRASELAWPQVVF